MPPGKTVELLVDSDVRIAAQGQLTLNPMHDEP